VDLVRGRKRVMAVMKHRTFDAALRVNGIGEEGYEKPNKAQIENTRNTAARVNKVYLDILVNGDKVSNEKLEISTRNRGRKKSRVSCVDTGGYSLHMTIRSYGSSNIMGADIVPAIALPSAIFSP
jgi:glutamine phosphoribosylpyrophosphate amidotransferase